MQKMKKTGLKIEQKLVMYFVVIIFVALFTSMYAINRSSRQNLQAEKTEKLIDSVDQMASLIDEALKSRIAVLEAVGKNELFTLYSADDYELCYKMEAIAPELGFRHIYVIDTKGTIKLVDRGIEMDASDDEAYLTALKGESIYSQSMASGDDMIVRVSVPVKNENGDVIAVLLATQELSAFGDIMQSSRYAAFLLSDEGEVLAHTNPELLNVEDAKQLAVQPDSEAGKANEQIKQKMISLESGFGEWIYEADGTAQFIAYAPIPSTEWSVAIMEEQSILAGVINAQRTKNAGKILPIFLIGTVAIWMIARELSSRIRTITEHLNILETGDFSKPVPEKLLKLKDELGAAGHSMAKMQQSVGAVLTVLKDSVAVMDYRANDLQEVSGNVQQATEGIAASTNQMAIGVQEQSNDLVNILEVINEFGLKLENVIEQLETVEMNTQSVNKEVDHGNQNAKELRASVESVNQSFIGFTKKINELSDNIKEITEITTLINAVAGQTNLLALNASIEAARAGEAGKGFAVVADEIRKLAEECRKSAEDINRMIDGISSEAGLLIEGSESLNKEMAGQIASITNTVNSYGTMNETIHEMVENIGAIASLVTELGGNKDNIISRVENATAVGEEITASTQEIAGSAEGMNETVRGVEVAAQSLKQVSDEFTQQVAKFTI